MKVICVGQAKTGTTSLAAALRILGFTVHDYFEQIEYNIDEYLEAFEGKMPDFVAMYKDIDATTDTPSCFFWKELHESFPKAKVILTERDSVDVWVESKMENGRLNFELLRIRFEPFCLQTIFTPTGRKFRRLMEILRQRFEDDQPKKLHSLYLEHNSRVKTFIPTNQLLVLNVKQGWKPLCEFLGVDVPDVTFPKLNTRQTNRKGITHVFKQSSLGRKLRNELIIEVTIVFIVLGFLIFMF